MELETNYCLFLYILYRNCDAWTQILETCQLIELHDTIARTSLHHLSPYYGLPLIIFQQTMHAASFALPPPSLEIYTAKTTSNGNVSLLFMDTYFLLA